MAIDNVPPILRYLANLGDFNLQSIINKEEEDNIVIIDSPYIDTLDVGEYLKNTKSNFSVLSLNVQSLNAKFNSILSILHDLQNCDFTFDAICLQETWVTGSPPDFSMFAIPNYTTIPLTATISSHSGLVIYLHNRHQYTLRNYKYNNSIWEGLFIDVFGDHIRNKITLGNIYRQPREQFIDEFLKDLNPILHSLGKQNNDIMLAGDFNIDLLLATKTQKHGQFLDLFISNGFQPNICLPTRVQATATLIDNIFYKKSNLNTSLSSGIIVSQISDHFPYFSCLNQNLSPCKPPKYKYIQSYNERSINNFIRDIENTDFLTYLNQDKDFNPDINYDTLEKLLIDKRNKFFPIKKVRVNKHKHKICPWITTGIIRSIKYRDKLYKKFKSCNSNHPEFNALKINLKTYNTILKKLIRNAKSQYYHEMFLKNQNNTKTTWNTVNAILNKNQGKDKFSSFFKIDNITVSDPQLICNKFNKYFTSIGSSFANKIYKPPDKSFKDYLKHKTKSVFKFKEIQPLDVIKTISTLKSKPSSGHDNISSSLIKRIAKPLSLPLSLIINQSLKTGIFPCRLKLAKVIPIFKKDDLTLFDNYRPISLLPVISKVFERVVFNQMYTYLSANNLLYDSQHGFRTLHSTETAALEFLDMINRSLDNGLLPLTLFLDLSKAFDTLDHNILLQKLEYYGISGTENCWFKSYLTNRQQFCVFDNVTSDLLSLDTGVPQGSILGPLLFLIYVNDINYASDFFDMILYADDTTLITPLFASDISSITPNLNNELSKIYDWLCLNRLSLNVKKTKYMLFHYPQRNLVDSDYPSLVLAGTPIDHVTEFDFLGLRVSETLSWFPHVSKISAKISKAIGILRRLKHILPTRVLLLIYNSLISSHMSYCILAWGFCSSRIIKLQKKAIRIVYQSK
jgi:endonuclease/exonuclease/phosphatase (EEP) superfamily protein YafD